MYLAALRLFPTGRAVDVDMAAAIRMRLETLAEAVEERRVASRRIH
jgi:hypothetical protein